MRYTVIMPVFNERAFIDDAVDAICHAPGPVDPKTGTPIVRDLIIVDDGSFDGTRERVENARSRWPGRIRTVLHEKNRGKGAAVRSGFHEALHPSTPDAPATDMIVIHDADREYDVRDHDALLAPILDGRADVVFGTRFLGQTHRVLYYWHALVNRGITMFSNMLTNLNLTDIECCLKAFSREAALGLELREDRFGIEPELVAKVSRLKLPAAPPVSETTHSPDSPSIRFRRARIFEVPVSYSGRTYEEGKKISWRDGVAAIGCIIKYNVPR
jgi:glycosyltransferase involved in cell wall biosynthesis